MASAGQVDVKVAVKPKVAVGTSTVAGGTVSLVAFALALVAFWQGARDEATISALVVGLVSLVTVLGGRYAQAVAALAVTAKRPAPVPFAYTGTATSGNVAASHFDPVAPGLATTKHREFDREPTAPHPDELRDLHDGDQT